LRCAAFDATARQVAFGVLLALIILALFGASLCVSRVAGTSPEENHLTDAVTIDG
jgi:hypothetical protein